MNRSSAPDLLSKAVAHHQSGRLSEAASLYQQVLTIEPNNPQALHNLGVVAHHQRRHEDAIALIGRAIKLKSDNAGYHYNLGTAHHALQHFEEAAAHYRRAVALKGDYAAANFNLGSALVSLEKFDEAADAYRQAIRLAPQVAEGHSNLADVLGLLGKLDEAEDSYRRALAIKPNLVQALNNLSRLLSEKGNAVEALVLSMRSLAIAESDEAKGLFVDYARHCSRTGRLMKPIDGLLPVLSRAIQERWLRPNEVMALASQVLELDPAVGKSIAAAAAVWPRRAMETELFGESMAAAVKNTLLLLLLESTPGSGRAMEKFVTAARAAMLERAARPDAVGEAILAFYASLAMQSFITEYALSTTEKELAQAHQARNDLISALASGADIAPVPIVAVAAYFPLATVPGAEKLLERKWPGPVSRLIDRQVREPLQERALRSSISRLTPIEDRVSLLVQQQYEENPYPRWVETTEAWRRPTHIDEYLRAMFPLAPLRPLGKNGDIHILIAGAGTGRQAVEVARQFPEARVLAVDLSVAALAYAKRKSKELRVQNIEYGQADIVELGTLGRQFDVIYASGVLHHLADPFAGWRGLLQILAPGGLMNVGLYSEKAREDIVAAQRFVASNGFKPTADDIRRCREEFERLPADSPLRNVMLFSDFYSISDLRDLLFHVQEHRMTLPQIARFLADNNLQFLGFDQTSNILQRYRQRFPDDKAMTNLDLWDRFEQENPRAFVGMYQFWLQKAGG